MTLGALQLDVVVEDRKFAAGGRADRLHRRTDGRIRIDHVPKFGEAHVEFAPAHGIRSEKLRVLREDVPARPRFVIEQVSEHGVRSRNNGGCVLPFARSRIRGDDKPKSPTENEG